MQESHDLGADPVTALICIPQACIESAGEERRLVAPQCYGIVITHYTLRARPDGIQIASIRRKRVVEGTLSPGIFRVIGKFG